jgi:hypothetical protein
MERERGIALGNAIVAIRSAAAYYSIKSLRDAYTLTFVRDILNGDMESSLPNPYRNLHETFPNWARAVREFCVGNIPVSRFGFMADPSSVAKSSTREAHADGDGPLGSIESDIYYPNSPELNTTDARTWYHAVRKVQSLIINNYSYVDTFIKIEFERVYELDALSGGGPLSSANFHHDAVTTSESVKAIAPFGFLNRAALFGSGTDRVHYKSYMFGSNILQFDNDLTNFGLLDVSMPAGTDRRHLQRSLDMSDMELKRFISNIITASGGIIVNPTRSGNSAKKRRKNNDERTVYVENDSDDDDLNAPYEGCVKFSSFNRLNNSIQFTFNTHGNRHYFTANVLLLKADDFCTNDLVYRRTAVSSLCQCEFPSLVWRLCVLVTPINCATIDGSVRNEVTKVVMAAFTAFHVVYQNKKATVDSRMVVMSGFFAIPIPPFLDKITRPKRNGVDHGENSLTTLCVFHRWLRAHSGSHWRTLTGNGSKTLIDAMDKQGGRAVIIQRPMLMTGTDAGSAGKRSFMRFMTYEDVVRKVLRLTRSSLMNGVSDKNCMVAYVRGQNDLIVFERTGAKFSKDDDASFTEREQKIVGGPVDLWRALFEAPSYVYIDLDVFVTLGYNIVSLAPGGRTFEHEDHGTGKTCTVFCSVLLRFVEDSTLEILNGPDEDITSIDQQRYMRYLDSVENSGEIKILHGRDNRLEVTGDRDPEQTRFSESVYDIGVYWPGVKIVKTHFVDPELKHLCFVYFTGENETRMTLERIYAFSNYCLRESILPAPILYTIQRIMLQGLYA